MRDISVIDSESAISIRFDDFRGLVFVEDLFYQGNPIQFEQVDIAGYGVDANGQFYWWRTKQPIVFTLSFFPGSTSDRTMSNIIEACTSGVDKDTSIKEAAIEYGDIAYYFSNGLLVSGMPAPNAGGDNRLGPKTYRFAFDTYTFR